MRRFSSYGPIDKDEHYYAPREELIDFAYKQLMGDNPQKGGHYITVWAPRQCGKTWIMQQILNRLQTDERCDAVVVNLEGLKNETRPDVILEMISQKIGECLGKKFTGIDTQYKFQEIFHKNVLVKPLNLLLDEVDALDETAINVLVGALRSLYIYRTYETKKNAYQKTYLLHAVALIGVRSVLGIENAKGSPFNVQHSVHIPNLTCEEVRGMFQWYEKETGQHMDDEVARTLYDETRGQPGITCWFGELLTETYNPDPKKPITMLNFREAYGAATHILPNNNILNLISKVKNPPYNEWIMELFKTGDKVIFNFDNTEINFLYMNGVIDKEKAGVGEYYVKFSSPFVQKRLFGYFSEQMFSYMGQLIHPLDDMKDAVDENILHLPNILKRYQDYLTKNREVFFKNVPRRKTDLKIYEAIYHFNLYRYLFDLLRSRGVEVIPQFPTGNGKIDLILKYRDRIYALELKSFKDMYGFEKGIEQAAVYGKQLGLAEIVFLVFVELTVEEAGQLKKEIDQNGVKVIVVPIAVLY